MAFRGFSDKAREEYLENQQYEKDVREGETWTSPQQKIKGHPYCGNSSRSPADAGADTESSKCTTR